MPRLRPCADSALLVIFEDTTEPRARVRALDRLLAATPIGGLVETVLGLSSLLLVIDPLLTSPSVVAPLIEPLLGDAVPASPAGAPGEPWVLPVVFGGEAGPDLEDVGRRAGLAAAEVVALVASARLEVALVGNLPGLPYLVGLPPPLQLPRRERPRTAVPAGSVALAAGMACVYPGSGPGGWHIVGRTPARLVDPALDPPFLLAPGDAVRLVPIDEREGARLDAEAAAGRWRPAGGGASL